RATAVHALAARCLEHAQSAAAGNLEDDVGILADHGIGLVFALGWISEVVAIVSQHLDAGILHLGGPLVTRDVVIDWRDGKAADGANYVGLLRRRLGLLQHAGAHAHPRARILLVEEPRLHLGGAEVREFVVSAGAVNHGALD